jgi:hypothetical protein
VRRGRTLTRLCRRRDEAWSPFLDMSAVSAVSWDMLPRQGMSAPKCLGQPRAGCLDSWSNQTNPTGLPDGQAGQAGCARSYGVAPAHARLHANASECTDERPSTTYISNQLDPVDPVDPTMKLPGEFGSPTPSTCTTRLTHGTAPSSPSRTGYDFPPCRYCGEPTDWHDWRHHGTEMSHDACYRLALQAVSQ